MCIGVIQTRHINEAVAFDPQGRVFTYLLAQLDIDIVERFEAVDRKVRSNHEQASARCAERLEGFGDEGAKPRTCLIEATLKAKSPVLNVEIEKTCYCVGSRARFVLIIVTIVNISYRDGVEREEQLVSCRAIETSSANRGCDGFKIERVSTVIADELRLRMPVEGA